MPEGYDQDTNPNPRQRPRRPRSSFTTPPMEAPPQAPIGEVDNTPAAESFDRPFGAGRETIAGWRDRPPIMPPPQAPAPPNVPPVPPTAPQKYNVSLMEGDPTKLASATHALKSPKYQFLQLAQSGRFNYDNLAGMLGELQQTNPNFWKDWVADGDKFRYTGDPNKLHGAWEGVTEVDAIGGYRSGNPQGFRWGARNPAAEAAAAQQAAMQQALSASQTAYAPGKPPQIPRPSTQMPQQAVQQALLPEQVRTLPPVFINDPQAERPFTQFGNLQRNAEAPISFGIGQDNDLRTYEPINNIPEFTRPEFGKYEDAQLNALLGVLQNPGIPEQQQKQMRQIQQEQLLAQRDEALDATRTN